MPMLKLTLVTPFVLLVGLAYRGAQSAGSEPSHVVVVTRDVLTISIAVDTARLASAQRDSANGWDMLVYPTISDQSSRLTLRFKAPMEAKTYRRPVRPATCHGLLEAHSCVRSTTATITNGRLVIAVRDSGLLAFMFSSRPTELRLLSLSDVTLWGEATVRYALPEVRPPTRDALIAHDRALRRERWSAWTRSLDIGAPDDRKPVRMKVGEKRDVGIVETQVRDVDDINMRSDVTVYRWTSSDPSVIEVGPAQDRPTHSPSVGLTALRPGTSMIMAIGIRSGTDGLPSSPRKPMLTRSIVVTR